MNYTELKRLAEAAYPGPWYLENGMNQVRDNADDFVCETGEDEPINSAFIAAANPAAVLALIAENERLHKLVSWQAGASNEVTISAGQLMKHMDERDQLKAENEALRREREGKVICDLELFETLRDSANTEADEHRQCMATYRPLRQANLDSVVKKCDDLLAAMGQGEQS